MAELVGRKLVENGQQRILQRLFEGVTSDMILDVSDSKDSQEHKLIHLVWRKFPRNRPIDEQKTIISHSTLTEEVFGPGLNKFPKKSFISHADASTSDAGWTSDCSSLSSDLVAQVTSGSGGPSFKIPTKGRARKPKIIEPKTWTKLTNRFKCFEENTPECDDILRETSRKSPPLFCSPKTEPMVMMSPSGISSVDGSPSTPSVPPVAAAVFAPEISKSVSEHKFKPEFLNAPTSLGPNPPVNDRRLGKVKWFDPYILRYGFIVTKTCSKDVFFHANDVHSGEELLLKEDDEVIFNFNEYGKRGTDVQLWPTFGKI